MGYAKKLFLFTIAIFGLQCVQINCMNHFLKEITEGVRGFFEQIDCRTNISNVIEEKEYRKNTAIEKIKKDFKKTESFRISNNLLKDTLNPRRYKDVPGLFDLISSLFECSKKKKFFLQKKIFNIVKKRIKTIKKYKELNSHAKFLKEKYLGTEENLFKMLLKIFHTENCVKGVFQEIKKQKKCFNSDCIETRDVCGNKFKVCNDFKIIFLKKKLFINLEMVPFCCLFGRYPVSDHDKICAYTKLISIANKDKNLSVWENKINKLKESIKNKNKELEYKNKKEFHFCLNEKRNWISDLRIKACS